MGSDGTFHTKVLTFLAMNMGTPSYLEIGCHNSDTMRVIKQNTDKVKMVAVDIVEPKVKLVGVDYYIMPSHKFLTDVLPYLSLNPAMSFIDADHSFSSARSDFLALWPSVPPGGLIFLHDTWPENRAMTESGYSGDCHKMVDWLRKEGYESVTLPLSPGLTIVRKDGSIKPWEVQ